MPLGATRAVLFGGGFPVATHTISVTADQGEHFLSALATADGWNGSDDLKLTVTYTVTQNGTTTANALVRAGTIPNTGTKSTIDLVINNAVELRAFGGAGGDGADGNTTSPGFNGDPGLVGQLCIDFNGADNSIAGSITNNGAISAGGGGGGGGGGGSSPTHGGGGGGGGARNGAGGLGPGTGDPGSTGGDTTGGSGGASASAGAGGAGGNRGVAGTTGSAGAGSTGGAGGAAGVAVDKSGLTVGISGTGSTFGAVSA